MSRIVRQSKFRHVFGTVFKKEDCYDDLRVSRSSWDSNLIAASPLYFGVCLEAGGGGAFGVYPWSASPKIDPKTPTIAGHKGAVLDIDFNPFHDSMVASVSEDCYGKIWIIPEGGLKDANLTDPVQELKGHKRKVGCVKFNPVAANILATAATDPSVKVWDVEAGKAHFSFDSEHADIIQSLDWNYNGSLLATACKDKKIRVLDPRGNKVAQEAEAHQGVKGARVLFLGRREKLFSTGFTKTSEREFSIWDPKNLSKPLITVNVDSASGLLMPFYDDDTSVLFLGGKGDGNIRYYEVGDEAPYHYYLSEFKSATPQRGLCMVPKRAVNVSECEIVRFLKVSVKLMEPISFQVPRKSDIFQDDIFPDTFSGEPTLNASEWFGGKNGDPKTVSLAPGFVQKPKTIEFNPNPIQEEKPLTEFELKQEVDKLSKRVAYLEMELVKRDAKIKELSG